MNIYHDNNWFRFLNQIKAKHSSFHFWDLACFFFQESHLVQRVRSRPRQDKNELLSFTFKHVLHQDIIGAQGWQTKHRYNFMTLSVVSSHIMLRVLMGLTVSREKGLKFNRQPWKKVIFYRLPDKNAVLYQMSKRVRSRYFRWSSRTSGSWRISQLEKQVSLFSKTLSLDITRPNLPTSESISKF